MHGVENLRTNDFSFDTLSKKIDELKARAQERLDDAVNVVGDNAATRQTADTATIALKGLAEDLSIQEQAMHNLDPSRIADLISDPFPED